MLDDTCLVTYTTTKYSDVWPMYFGQLNEFLGNIKSYVLCNATQDTWPIAGHTLLSYDDCDPYWKQYVEGVSKLQENYVIYAQEDFVLFNHVNTKAIEKYRDFLENQSEYSYIRLIRCGYETPLYKNVCDDLYEININSSDAFSMQATLWKKSKLLELYSHVKSQKWLESDVWNQGARDLNIKGCFTYNNEPKIGKFHYDSVIYPYICTAINKGMWYMRDYPQLMEFMLKKYNVDTSIRGMKK